MTDENFKLQILIAVLLCLFFFILYVILMFLISIDIVILNFIVNVIAINSFSLACLGKAVITWF